MTILTPKETYQTLFDDLLENLNTEGALKGRAVRAIKNIQPEEEVVLEERHKELAYRLKAKPSISQVRRAIELINELKDNDQNTASKLFISELRVEY